jgi:hypothetical protein
VDDCYLCGDGVEYDPAGGHWWHSEDLAIDVNGKAVMTDCAWGKPFAPGSGMPFQHLR